jgi:hypothetical protein
MRSELRITTLAVSLLIVVALTARGGASCAVSEIGPGFDAAKAVFVGQVLSTRVERSATDPYGVRTVATVRVLQRWKGPETATLEVSACGGGDVVCTVSMEFKRGQRYLFFAEGEPLSTSDCMSRPIDRAVTELKWLKQKPSTKLG